MNLGFYELTVKPSRGLERYYSRVRVAKTNPKGDTLIIYVKDGKSITERIKTQEILQATPLT